MKHRDYIPDFFHILEPKDFRRDNHHLRFVVRNHMRGWFKHRFQTMIERQGRMNRDGFYVKVAILEPGRKSRVFREL